MLPSFCGSFAPLTRSVRETLQTSSKLFTLPLIMSVITLEFSAMFLIGASVLLKISPAICLREINPQIRMSLPRSTRSPIMSPELSQVVLRAAVLHKRILFGFRKAFRLNGSHEKIRIRCAMTRPGKRFMLSSPMCADYQGCRTC